MLTQQLTKAYKKQEKELTKMNRLLNEFYSKILKYYVIPPVSKKEAQTEDAPETKQMKS